VDEPATPGHTRIDCLDAAKEYRADGQVDTAPTVDQHHHGAQWLWA
jgi:hypothetical protein